MKSFSSLVMTGWKDAPLVPLIMLHSALDHQSNELVKGK